MKLYVINPSYVDYLKEFDKKVPNVDYDGGLKLFLGKVTISDDSAMGYYIPLTSGSKTKFEKMPNRLDFVKITDPIDGEIIGAIDINNMIPAPDKVVSDFTYDLVRDYSDFETKEERDKYFRMSLDELEYLNKMEDHIIGNARTIFSIYRSKSKQFENLRRRCCRFIDLYNRALEYNDVLNYEMNNLIENITDQFKGNSYKSFKEHNGKEI
jgi:protein AbiQ